MAVYGTGKNQIFGADAREGEMGKVFHIFIHLLQIPEIKL